jgi:very-short-patch-repair endonuclease
LSTDLGSPRSEFAWAGHPAPVKVETGLKRCGGAARWERLREVGVSEQALRAARQTELHVGHGAYALPEAPLPLVTAVRMAGVLSHATAADFHGFALWTPDKRIHVTVPSWRPPEAGVCFHRGRLCPDDLDPFRPMTSALRTALDCGRSMALLEAVVVLDSAVHGRRVRPEVLRAAAAAVRGHGAAALRRAVQHMDELAESPMESVLRTLISLLPCRVSIQVRFRGVGRVDLVLDGWLVIEADGFEHHSNRREYREDRRRGNLLVEHGVATLRYSYEDLQSRPWEVLAQIERVLKLGLPRTRH